MAHSVGLTASGCLYTWGDNGAGQCGVGCVSSNELEDDRNGSLCDRGGVTTSFRGKRTTTEEEREGVDLSRRRRHSADVRRGEGLEEVASLCWVSFTHLPLTSERTEVEGLWTTAEDRKKKAKEMKDGILTTTQRRFKRLYERKRREEDSDKFVTEYVSIPVEVPVYEKAEKSQDEDTCHVAGSVDFLRLRPSLLPRISFSQVACGADYSAAVSLSGCLYTWGSNTCGVLGLGDTRPRSSPCLVDPYSLIPACEQLFSSTSHGRLKENSGGRSFSSISPDVNSRKNHVEGLLRREEKEVGLCCFPPSRVARVACGNSHMGVVVEGGSLFLWGSNWRGECGYPSEKERKREDIAGHGEEDGEEDQQREEETCQAEEEIRTPRELCVFDLAPLRQRFLPVYEAVMLWAFIQPGDEKNKQTNTKLSPVSTERDGQQKEKKHGDRDSEGEQCKRGDGEDVHHSKVGDDPSHSRPKCVAEPREGVRLYVCPSKRSFTMALLPSLLPGLCKSVRRTTKDARAADKLLQHRLVFSLLSCGSVHTLALGHISLLGAKELREESSEYQETKKKKDPRKRDSCASKEQEMKETEESKGRQKSLGCYMNKTGKNALEGTDGGEDKTIYRGYLYAWGKDSGNCLGLGGKIIDASQDCPARLRPELFKRESPPSLTTSEGRQQQGRGEEEEKTLKMQKGQQQEEMLEVFQVAAGGTTSAIVDRHHRLWLWGDVTGICGEFFRYIRSRFISEVA